MSSLPQDLRYTPDHEWLRAAGTAWRVGITEFAATQFGEIVIIDLPEEGKLVTRGEAFGSAESVKSVSELYAPVSGKIIAVNAALKDSPEKVNEDPYGEGWMIEIEPNNKAEIDELMTPDAYSVHIAAQ